MHWRGLIVLVLSLHTCTAGPDTTSTFYVYEGPAYQAVSRALIQCFADHNENVKPWGETYLLAEHMTEIWVHRALLDHPLRTRDPSRASFFFVPSYLVLSLYLQTQKQATGCLPHRKAVAALLNTLQRSPWFQRFGGSDHAIVCGAYTCRHAFVEQQMEAMARVVVGTSEPGAFWWTCWSCANRVVNVPYIGRSDIPLEAAEVPPSLRPVSFFFWGSGRHRKERECLVGVNTVLSDADVRLLDQEQDPARQSKPDATYATAIARARFCFSPRGDTATSRRLFDAVAAGCIPIVPELLREQGGLPFEDDVPYERFVVFVPDEAFTSEEKVADMALEISGWPQERVDVMHRELLQWRPYVAVAATTGDTFDQIRATQELATAFLHATRVFRQEQRWSCLPPFNPRESDLLMHREGTLGAKVIEAQRQQRLNESVYPVVGRRDEWLAAAEARIDASRRLLLCNVPGSGAEPLAAAMRLNSTTPSTPLLPLDEEDNNSGDGGGARLREAFGLDWVQVRVVRDPAVRLLAVYLEEHAEVSSRSAGDGEAFRAFVRELAQRQDAKELDEDPLYRPQAGYCGARYRPFAATLRQEALYNDGRQLLMSLGLWKRPGVSEAWGCDNAGTPSSVGQLFHGCEWAAFYDSATLRIVSHIYAEDYMRSPWYHIGAWIGNACLPDGGSGALKP